MKSPSQAENDQDEPLPVDGDAIELLTACRWKIRLTVRLRELADSALTSAPVSIRNFTPLVASVM